MGKKPSIENYDELMTNLNINDKRKDSFNENKENINGQNRNALVLEDKFKDPSNPQDTFSQIEFDTKDA